MHTARLVANDDDNELLNWLDGHSVSVSRGLSVRLLLSRWQKAGRDHSRLLESLRRLMDADWVAPVPHSEPPHLRFTPSGYARLLEETTTQTIAIAPFDAAPEGAAESTPAETRSAPAAQPAADVPEVAEVLAPIEPAPPLFVTHGKPLTELALRNQVLAVFRDLKLRAGQQMIAVTLTRYWQETGLRGEDLRRAIDVVIRDGYLVAHRDGMDLYWQLTAAGEAWLRAPLTPQPLLAAAPALKTLPAAAAVDERDLCTVAATCIQRAGGSGDAGVEYGALAERWARTSLDENALLHALDWLAKSSRVEIFVDDHGGTCLRLTADGNYYATQKPVREAARLIKLLD